MFIITHPNVYNKLQAELDRAALSEPIIRESEARALPYLQACIKEGLRVFPPVTALATKTVPESGDRLRGQFIPGGTNIVYSAWDFYKNHEVFGEDAEVFRPERWLEATGDRLSRMQQTLDLVFGYGKYGCLGKPVALLEINKFIAEVRVRSTLLDRPSLCTLIRRLWKVFRRYDIALINPTNPWKSYNRNGFFFQSEMWVRMSEREPREQHGGRAAAQQR